MLVQYMRAHVYRLYLRGVRLPRPSQAVEGELYLVPGDAGSNHPDALIAELRYRTADKTSPTRIPALHWAKVRRISGNGLVITGTEIIARGHGSKAKADHWHQAWWVLVGATDQDIEERMQEGDHTEPPIVSPERQKKERPPRLGWAHAGPRR
jgi:hypothetical protein